MTARRRWRPVLALTRQWAPRTRPAVRERGGNGDITVLDSPRNWSSKAWRLCAGLTERPPCSRP